MRLWRSHKVSRCRSGNLKPAPSLTSSWDSAPICMRAHHRGSLYPWLVFMRQRQLWSTSHPRLQCSCASANCGYISSAPAALHASRHSWSTKPRMKCFPSPTAVVEYISPTPAVLHAPAPIVEYISPTPAVFQSLVPVAEYISPAPAVSQSTAPIVEYISPRRQCFKRHRQ